jgi:hypothetical protein
MLRTRGRFLRVSTDKRSVRYEGEGMHTNDVGAIQVRVRAPARLEKGTRAIYSDEKAANRGVRVWARQRMALERWTNPTLSWRTCSSRYRPRVARASPNSSPSREHPLQLSQLLPVA